MLSYWAAHKLFLEMKGVVWFHKVWIKPHCGVLGAWGSSCIEISGEKCGNMLAEEKYTQWSFKQMWTPLFLSPSKQTTTFPPSSFPLYTFLLLSYPHWGKPSPLVPWLMVVQDTGQTSISLASWWESSWMFLHGRPLGVLAVPEPQCELLEQLSIWPLLGPSCSFRSCLSLCRYYRLWCFLPLACLSSFSSCSMEGGWVGIAWEGRHKLHRTRVWSSHPHTEMPSQQEACDHVLNECPHNLSAPVNGPNVHSWVSTTSSPLTDGSCGRTWPLSSQIFCRMAQGMMTVIVMFSSATASFAVRHLQWPLSLSNVHSMTFPIWERQRLKCCHHGSPRSS